jgi:hypothetical protein
VLRDKLQRWDTILQKGAIDKLLVRDDALAGDATETASDAAHERGGG